MTSKSPFQEALRELGEPDGDRSWVFVPYDQLTDELGPLASRPPRELGIVLVENVWKASLRPYHKQKLALVLASLRHFALEQARRGVAVRHVVADGPYRDALRPLCEELGPLVVMEPAERELRRDLEPLVEKGLLRVVPHEGWLTSEDDFEEACGSGPPWRMDSFYRHVRRRTGILMEDGKPAGGKFSFDAENRRPWKGEPPAPEPPRFRPNEITQEVGELVESRFGHHPGELDLGALPASGNQVQRLWEWAREECLPVFGPFEDAMSTRSSGLFHTRIAPLVNLHRITPRRVVEDTLELDLPLPSREGFLRQVLGWREFVRHVHRATDGFRSLPERDPPVGDAPGDGGWGRWRDEEWKRRGAGDELAGGARPSHLGTRGPVFSAFWGQPSGLRCLDETVRGVWREAYSHHILRLMVLSNLATLLDVAPRELCDWFWVAYADAYDWVVEPNVLAMGTFGAGPLMTTKPYVSGAAYIDRMSDFCGDCRFDPKRDCPITPMYWAFLARHREAFEGNPRLAMPLRSLDKRGEEQRERDARVYERVRRVLLDGRELTPEDTVS